MRRRLKPGEQKVWGAANAGAFLREGAEPEVAAAACKGDTGM